VKLATQTYRPDLSLIIVSYNTVSLLRACLASVSAQLAPASEISPTGLRLSGEIIVVDNGSTDGSQEMVCRDFSTATLLENERNLGFAQACNQGLAAAAGRHLLLLNSDTTVGENALAEMVGFLDAHTSVGMVGPKLVYPDGSFQHSSFAFPNLAMTFLDFFPINHRLTRSRLNGRYPERFYRRPFQIDHPLGACMLIAREAFEEIGPLDEGFFMYCEEIDWCYRLKQRGWSIWCVPSAEVAHHGGASARQIRGPMYVALQRSRYRLFRKYHGPAFFQAAKWITRAGMLAEGIRAWQAERQGQITPEEKADSWRAYGEVLKLD
jgi:N-acetylglucosaminyl-diphospho-decaprenol L-rhamnosyltransferase